ncbi:hypothetical protein BC629DRAFT_1525833 [Irpex lacteus]|nr:hypothetical protein BC629DRAFT_1525833 [Irpex lacteus]
MFFISSSLRWFLSISLFTHNAYPVWTDSHVFNFALYHTHVFRFTHLLFILLLESCIICRVFYSTSKATPCVLLVKLTLYIFVYSE